VLTLKKPEIPRHITARLAVLNFLLGNIIVNGKTISVPRSRITLGKYSLLCMNKYAPLVPVKCQSVGGFAFVFIAKALGEFGELKIGESD
jgi:hypothetical protein